LGGKDTLSLRIIKKKSFYTFILGVLLRGLQMGKVEEISLNKCNNNIGGINNFYFWEILKCFLMKKSTLIASIVLVLGLLGWYFFIGPGKEHVEASVVGMDCDNPEKEIYLLIKNQGNEKEIRNIQLKIHDVETDEETTVLYEMKEELKAYQFRQDTVFIPQDQLVNTRCENYEIKVKVKK
jgi:hypothetical protein